MFLLEKGLSIYKNNNNKKQQKNGHNKLIAIANMLAMESEKAKEICPLEPPGALSPAETLVAQRN